MATFWCAAPLCVAGQMVLVAVTGQRHGVCPPEAVISIALWLRAAGLCDGIGFGEGTSAHEGMGR